MIMSKDDLFSVSWIALLGLAVVLVSVIVGIPIAGALEPKNDETLVGGLVWGAVAGVILGGAIVGVLCRRMGLSGRIPLVAAPGTLISAPLFCVAILAREWPALLCAGALTLGSGLAAALGSFAVRRKGRSC